MENVYFMQGKNFENNHDTLINPNYVISFETINDHYEIKILVKMIDGSQYVVEYNQFRGHGISVGKKPKRV